MAVDGPLVGRARELAVLTGALAAVKDGQGGLLLLAGEAGVGEIRLVDEALAATGLLVLRGEAGSEGSVSPQVEDCTIDGVAHLLHRQRPEPVAQGVAEFFARHPLARIIHGAG